MQRSTADLENGSVIIAFATPVPDRVLPYVSSVSATEATPLLMRASLTGAGSVSPRSLKSRALLVVAVTICSVVAAFANVNGVHITGPAIQFSAASRKPLGAATHRLHEELLNLYTQGPLLDAIQRANIFNDSKHFVDMPVKRNSSVHQILLEFQREIQPIVGSSGSSPSAVQTALRSFLDTHFDEPGSEIQKTVPTDFTESPAPPQIAAIGNPGYRKWATALHALWKELGRTPLPDVVSSYLHPTPLPALSNTKDSPLIVVPGGRFRESYYWDSYWIVQGLLVSNMPTTARRVVQNLLEYVAEFGFVPNGGRIYYLTRSQPPLLSDMVRLVAATEPPPQHQQQAVQKWDLDYLRVVVPILAKEYTYWMETHAVNITVKGATYTLNRYTANANAPRPESYREDIHLADAFFPLNIPRQQRLYNDIIAAAESGWDFSSRWFQDYQTLATIDTQAIVPVDLNAVMYRVETNLALFYKALGDKGASKRMASAASDRTQAIDAVLWQQESHSWRDFDLRSVSHSPVVSASNYFPLWAGSFHAFGSHTNTKNLDKIVDSLRHSGLIQVAGIQTTTQTTGQQWDAPNAWPPLQDILIEGLRKVDTASSRALAKELVVKWIDTSFEAWNTTGLMFEKYNATVIGGLGAGGEYTPQFGFGWTNGVVLKFLTEYQDWLA